MPSIEDYNQFERDIGGALASNMSRTTASRVGPAGPFDRANNALETAHRLALRVESLRDRLLGSTPENPGSDVSPSNGGVFSDLERSADRTLEALAGAEAALVAIERNLP